VSTAIMRVPVENSGIAIGFYNLTINIAVPVGIAYTAALMKLKPDLLGGIAGSGPASSYGSVLLILTGVAVVGLVLYRVFIVVIDRKGTEADTLVEQR
jgi:DHA2 family metal-tetracycline-proton antiporter-like MFS transporter